MIRWEKYIYSVKDYIILTVWLTISFILVLNNEKPQIQWIRSKVLSIYGLWQNSVSSVYQYRVMRLENDVLRERLALLSYENSLMKEALLENHRLKKLLVFERNTKYDLIPASIIRRNYQGFSHVFFINVGSDDGVQENMPVVSSEGLIGKVFSKSGESSIVQVLDDINFRVSAMIQRSRVTGMVRPDEYLNLQLDYLVLRTDVKVGDVVVTSGYSNIYPKGIEIGYVSKIDTIKAELFKLIHIQPSVDLTNLEEAFVILK